MTQGTKPPARATSQVVVVFDELEGNYLCGCCYEEMQGDRVDAFSLAQLDCCYGGNPFPMKLVFRRISVDKLLNRDCFCCGLSVARSFL